MEGFKGTPAPWFAKPVAAAVVEGDLNIIQTNSSHGKGYHIGYVSTWGDNEQTAIEAQANANLIAAAPELLEALHAMLNKAYKQNWNDQYPDEVEAAQNAISKALGQ